jgi:SAM-dependent methyltransferase
MKDGFTIRVENSAPSQRRPAQSVTWAAPLLKNQGVESIVDFGCGRLRNLKSLQEFFANITLVDTEIQCGRIERDFPEVKSENLVDSQSFFSENKKFDAFLCISVLHIVPIYALRRKIIKKAFDSLNEGGFFVTDVPSSETYYARKKDTLPKYRDGMLLGAGQVRTFYKNFSAKEFDEMISDSSKFSFWKKYGQDKHIIRIWRR